MKRNRLTQNSAFKFLILVVLPLVLLILCQFAVPAYYTRLLTLFMINVVLTASLNLTNGFAGIFSMGQAAFMAIGAYVSSLLTMDPQTKMARIVEMPAWFGALHLPFIPAILVAGLVAVLAALLIGYPVVHAKGHYLALMTLGLIVIVKDIISNNEPYTNGSKGISGIPNDTSLTAAFLAMVVTLLILYKITHSAFGRNMVAVRDDAAAAASLGINATRCKLIAFAVSALFGAVGGALWAHFQRNIAPGFFYFNETFSILEMSVLGGMYTLSGAIPGAAILTFLPQWLSTFESGVTIGKVTLPAMFGLSNIVLAAIFILVIIFRREGIMGRSDYIAEGIFSAKTYRDLVKRETWTELTDILGGMFKHSRKKATV
jgi:branched-chain amino acid transport system permease protein